MPCVQGHAQPKVWRKVKAQVRKEMCQEGQKRCGRWSKDAQRRADALYTKMGGAYCGTSLSGTKRKKRR